MKGNHVFTRTFRKTFGAILVAAALVLTGCGTANDSPTDGTTDETDAPETTDAAPVSPEASENGDDPITTISDGTLTVALSTGDRPSSYLDENDEPAGFVVELIEHIATALDLDIEWVVAATDTHIPGVANGSYDVGTIAALITPERLEQVSFTKPIQFARATVVSEPDTAFASFADVEGRLGVATDAFQSLAEANSPDAEIIRFEDATGAYTALRAGQVRGIILGYNPALTRQEEDPTLVLSEPLTTGEAGLAISYDNPGLLEAFNGALEDLAADGTLARLHLDNFGYPQADDIHDVYEEFSE